MNLVGYDPQIVILDDGRNLLQLFFTPHSARRIVGIAPDNQLDLRICSLFGKVGKIDGKIAAVVFQ